MIPVARRRFVFLSVRICGLPEGRRDRSMDREAADSVRCRPRFGPCSRPRCLRFGVGRFGAGRGMRRRRYYKGGRLCPRKRPVIRFDAPTPRPAVSVAASCVRGMSFRTEPSLGRGPKVVRRETWRYGLAVRNTGMCFHWQGVRYANTILSERSLLLQHNHLPLQSDVCSAVYNLLPPPLFGVLRNGREASADGLPVGDDGAADARRQRTGPARYRRRLRKKRSINSVHSVSNMPPRTFVLGWYGDGARRPAPRLGSSAP